MQLLQWFYTGNIDEMQGKVSMLRDVDSIKNMNELSFGLEDTTYTTVQRELRS
jgi:hypothetical protein